MPVGSLEPNPGLGNQVSSTVPSPHTVANPIPAAEVTVLHASRWLGPLAWSVVLDLTADPVALTAALIDIPSVSRGEARIADEVEAALRKQAPGYEVIRNGNAVLARTAFGKPTRVLLAGHLDTVPIADNVPSWRDGDRLFGCGTSDMKSGDAVFLHLAATVTDPAHDVTLVFYDREEIESSANGLGRIERELPDWLRADLAILGEPTDGHIEAGCQGTLRVLISTTGTRAHSARSWLGDNAIHKLAPVPIAWPAIGPGRLTSTAAPTARACPRSVSTGSRGKRHPGRRVPDRQFPVRAGSLTERRIGPREGSIRRLDIDLRQTDVAAGALPGFEIRCRRPHRRGGGSVRAKYGWTDVSRFAALGVAAVNYGPGDPNLAHRRDESVDVGRIAQATEILRNYLTMR